MSTSYKPAESGAAKSPPIDPQIARVYSERTAALRADLEKRKAGVETKEQDNKEIDVVEHNWPVERVFAEWKTSPDLGLDDARLAEMREKYGLNELTPPPTKHWLLVFIGHLTGFFSLLLWGAGILCFIAYGLDQDQPENLYLGIVLVTVVFLTGCFSYFQDAKSSAVMEGFKNFLPESSLVTRNGADVEIPSNELVPGDVVKIKSGEKIPADIRLFATSNFKVDNASLTGESLPQTRTPDNTHESALEATNLCFYGTLATNGNARGVVIRTGDRTVIGTIANLAASTGNVQTPIAIEIEHFIHIISAVAVFLGVTFLLIGVIKGTDAVENVVFCIGIIVANVPEGLLATVTVSLTLTAQRMAEKKVLVKNLESVETLGSTSVIASDKTGTLTQNRMTVAHLWYDDKTYLAHGKGPEAFDPENPSFNLLRLCINLCNNAVFAPGSAGQEIIKRATIGDASESAFIKFCESVEPIMQVRAAHPKIAEIPFNSANKFQVTIHNWQGNWDNDRMLMMKGAPERVWMRCDYVLIGGKKIPIAEVQDSYDVARAALMGGGERVLGCAMLELPAGKFPQDYEYSEEEPYNFPMQGMTFLGLVSMIDPPRAAVPGAVLNCQSAGIKVIMVTGDHPDTAEAIAKQVHIIRDPTQRDIANKRGVSMDEVKVTDPEVVARVVTGAELATLSEEEIDEVLDYDQLVFARTSPAQKLIIVQGLQNKKFIKRGLKQPKRVKYVVAVTGDGVNDSPALKAANIGVAMGIVGSDVAKDAADMILLNDNFASIVDGVEEGRLIFDNLKKSIAYTLSSNIPEISPFLINILTAIPLPLPTVLILCIDLGTDMIPAISLAYENKESNIMQKPPRDMHVDRLVTTKLISFSYLQVGVVQALAGFYCYFVVLNDYGFRPSDLPDNEDIFDDDNENQLIFNPTFAQNPSTRIHRTVTYDGNTIVMQPCNIHREDVCHRPFDALQHAQTSFFISIVVVQWADIMACKTRTLSLKHQGMRNNMLNFGLFFETALGAFLCYTPGLNDGLGTRDISFVHWLPALPFFIFIIVYDETRKYFMRTNGKNNWLERNTYY